MAKQKSPFKGFTLQEVKRAEQNSFVVRIGNDFYNNDGNFVFTQSQAEKHYETLLDNILYTIKNGNQKQKTAAEKCLLSLHIQALRIQ